MATKAKGKKKTLTESDQRLCIVSADYNFGGVLMAAMNGGKVATYSPEMRQKWSSSIQYKGTLRSLTRHIWGPNQYALVLTKVVHVKKLTGWKDNKFAPVG